MNTMHALGSGALDKMRVVLADPVQYALPLGDDELSLNDRVGTYLRLEFLGIINCSHCGRKTKRSFGQGYCFPCFRKLARCDSCIVKPETCHFHLGSCREPDWAQSFCMQDHLVYLANSSGLKVGITRANQVPTRWIDQGAVQALPILRVATRQQSGLAEVMFGASVADKTNWRAMLKGHNALLDLESAAETLLGSHRQGLEDLRMRFGADAFRVLGDSQVTAISYPVLQYPDKPVSLNFDKTPMIEGMLMGIKGQYLILDTGVLNIRNFTAYQVRVDAIQELI